MDNQTTPFGPANTNSPRFNQRSGAFRAGLDDLGRVQMDLRGFITAQELKQLDADYKKHRQRWVEVTARRMAKEAKAELTGPKPPAGASRSAPNWQELRRRATEHVYQDHVLRRSSITQKHAERIQDIAIEAAARMRGDGPRQGGPTRGGPSRGGPSRGGHDAGGRAQ